MKMTTKEELEHQLNRLDLKLEDIKREITNLRLEQSSQQSGLWKPKIAEKYFWIDTCNMNLIKNSDFDKEVGSGDLSIGNCFRTQEDAEKHLEYLEVETQLRDIAARLNKGREINWGTGQPKYYLFYDHIRENIGSMSALRTQVFDVIYCLDENFKDVAISEIGEERLRNYLKEC